MTLTLQELKNASSALPTPERADLAYFLLRSLEPKEDGWDQAWQEELDRRLEETRSGAVPGVPAGDVLKRLRERYP